MKTNHRRNRILALEIRSRRLAFAVLEGTSHLLECGIRRWCSDVKPAKWAMERIDPLLKLYSPSVVVLKQMSNVSKTKKRKMLILAIKWEMAKRFIDVHLIERTDVKEVFRQSGSQNKYLIAAAIAQMFPELKWKLPQKRRPWQPERYNAAIFDAVALAITCSTRCGVSVKPQGAKDI
jgi:hypothetical protein